MVKKEDVQLVQPKKDHEIEMAVSQTKSVALNSVQILNTLKSGQYDELPAWVQSKLTLSKHNLQSVYDYMLGKHEQVTESSMDFAKAMKKRGFIKKGQDDKTREKQIEKYLDKWANKDFKGAYPSPWVRRIKIPGHGPAQDWWMDTFYFVGKLLGESTDSYKKSLEKMANDKQLKMLSKKDKETLMKIAKMMKKNEARNERKEELVRLTNMLEAKMRPNVMKLLKQKGYGPVLSAIDDSKRQLKQMKYSRGEIEDTLISMFGDEDQKILKKIKESINEKKGDFLNSLFPKSKVQKAIQIAKDMGGNMTGAVKKIEKFFPGMTLNTDVQDALRKANEGMMDKVMKKMQPHRGKNVLPKGKKGNTSVPYGSGYDKVDEQQKKRATDIRRRYDTAYLKFEREVRDVIKMVNKYQGDKTDGRIIAKQFKKSLTPLDDLMQSWTAGQHRNPNITEDVYAIVDKFDDKKQDYDQVYFKDNDLNKVKKHMKKMGSKYGKMNLIQVKSNGKMSLVERMDKRQAGVMLKQLGGNRFIMMTGAKNFGVGPKGAGFKIGRNSKGVNFVRIDLKNDLYDMEFFQVRAGKMKLKSKVKQIFADQLQDMFTKHTGMYTSL
tara:strand:- start:124 stop:1941 length:1818 start_codon:yes stop_codon:yes gene_type:complete